MESLGLMDLIELCCNEAPDEDGNALDVSRSPTPLGGSRQTTKLYLKFVVVATLVTLLASN